jgi:hypothetical protein
MHGSLAPILLSTPMSHPSPTVQSSLAEVWYLKDIKFHGKDLRIITQNFNGYATFQPDPISLSDTSAADIQALFIHCDM